MNGNRFTKPRMPRVQHRAENDPVGVLKPGCTNIAYFMSDGYPNANDYTTIANKVQGLAEVRAYGIGSADLSTLNIVDSNDAELLKSAADLTSAFTSSQLRRTDISSVDILLNGQIVKTIAAANLIEDTIGLSFKTEIGGLSVDLSSSNKIEVKANFTDTTWKTTSLAATVYPYDSTLTRRSRGFNFDGDMYDDVLLQTRTGAGSTVSYAPPQSDAEAITVGAAAAAAAPTSSIAIWSMDDTAIKTGTVAKILSDPNWKALGSSDFDGDGKSDILLQNTDGRVAVWSMNGTTIASGGVVKTLSDTNWSIATVGDFDGNGSGDVMLKHTDGRIALWQFNGGQFTNGTVIKR